MTLYLPVGIPASGKSTLRNHLIDAGLLVRDAVVCPDDLRRILTGDENCQTANQEVFSLARHITDARLVHKLDVWIDATNLTGIADWIGMADFHRLPHLTIMLHDAGGIGPARERNRSRPNPVPEAAMDRMEARFRSFNKDAARPWVTADRFLADKGLTTPPEWSRVTP